MTRTITLLALPALLLFSGCAATDVVRFDDTKRTPTQSVDVYHFDSDTPKPTRSFKAIASLTFMGPRQDEPKARRYFISEAKKLGANAVVVEPPEALGTSGNNWGVSTSFYFKAKAVVFQ